MPGVYLLEGFTFYSQICEITRNFEKIQTHMGNNPVGKKANTPKVNPLYLPFYVNI